MHQGNIYLADHSQTPPLSHQATSYDSRSMGPVAVSPAGLIASYPPYDFPPPSETGPSTSEARVDGPPHQFVQQELIDALSEGCRKKTLAKAPKGGRRKAERDPVGQIPATSVRADAWGVDKKNHIVWFNPHHPDSRPLPQQAQQLRLCVREAKDKFICLYISPNPLARDQVATACGERHSSFQNWHRHLRTIHAEAERGAIQEGHLTQKGAVALKDPKCPLVRPRSMCTFPSCGWSSNEVRPDRAKQKHWRECHGMLTTRHQMEQAD